MPRIKIGPAKPARDALDLEIARLRALEVGVRHQQLWDI
jgi:hypothetical protein